MAGRGLFLLIASVQASLFFSLTAAANPVAPDYAYPYANSWLATVSTALVKSPGRFSYDDYAIAIELPAGSPMLGPDPAKMPLRLYRQPLASPASSDLVILVPGLGASVNDSIPNFLADSWFAAGHSVLVVPNDFTPAFALSASATGIVGVPSLDATDMRRALAQALLWLDKSQGFRPSKVALVGYSLGALQVGWVAAQEKWQPMLNLAKVVLINSPVDLYYGMQELDHLASLAKKMSDSSRLFLQALQLNLGWKIWTGNEADPFYYLGLNHYLPVSDGDLQSLVGASFQSSLDETAPVVQQTLLNRDPDCQSRGRPGSATTTCPDLPSLSGFVDYLEKIVLPNLDPQLGLPSTASELAAGQSLDRLQAALAGDPKIFIFHNEDDFLLRPEQPAYLRATYGAQATIFPHGGHMGNIWFSANDVAILQALQ